MRAIEKAAAGKPGDGSLIRVENATGAAPAC
jgi:hypothetical protein